MHNWNDSLKGVLFGALTGIAVGLGGFILTEIPKTHAMGGVVFLLVPFAAGVAITVVSHDLGRISAAVLLATVGSLTILIAMKMETPVCAMMAFPLLFVGLLAGVGLGYALGYLFRKLMGRFGGNHATFTSIILLAMPLLVFAGHRLEVSNPIQARRQMVISTIRIRADPSQVWAESRIVRRPVRGQAIPNVRRTSDPRAMRTGRKRPRSQEDMLFRPRLHSGDSRRMVAAKYDASFD